jgi:aspartokinase/homoserine dehydrogenase 1
MELSHFGAKVLHPPTVHPALEANIPIRIRNTFNPKGKSTIIKMNTAPSKWPIRGISAVPEIALVRVQGPRMVGAAGFASRLFGALGRERINVILITQASSEYSICFAVAPQDADDASEAVQKEFAREMANGSLDKPIVERDMSIIAVVGTNMKQLSGLSGKVFYALGRNGVNVKAIAQGSSEINISAVVAKSDRSKAMNAIHEAFFLGGVRSVNLFLVGAGLIGGTLLKQLGVQQSVLAEKYQTRSNLIGVSDLPGMLVDPNGINPSTAKENLSKGEKNDLDKFIDKMIELNLPNSAFCDCTASEMVASKYSRILRASIPVVTPNKKANSGTYAYYDELTSYSRERNIPYLYEVTVCAGLPVISTLRDLHLSGDHVKRIEAIVSGTLSFIFNNFDGSKPFSALVREAKEKGYTEPDPREDLKATDSARKALILARECGEKMEFSDVQIEPILNQACINAPDVDAFFKELEKCDADFEAKRAAAAKNGKALRYVVVVEDHKAILKLREEPPESPFRSLVDSDNMVVITTERYNKLPIVIKGPGAGAQVTAGGVFADIVRIARTLV